MPTSDKARAELDTLLASLELMTDDDAWYLAELWGQEDATARKRAWASAKDLIESAGLTGELDRLRGTISEWMQASSSDFQGIEGLLGSAGSGAGARQSAAPALIDAVAALLAGPGLSGEDKAVLLGPWQGLGEDEAEG